MTTDEAAMSPDNHDRAERMTDEERLRDRLVHYESFAIRIFKLVGMEFTGPCPCHGFPLGCVVVAELANKLGVTLPPLGR